MRKKGFAVAGLAIAAAVGGGAAFAEPSVAGACGFYEDSRVAYYNHCGDGVVRIHVDWEGKWGFNDEEICVRPGLTGLGNAEEIMNAYYIDTDC